MSIWIGPTSAAHLPAWMDNWWTIGILTTAATTMATAFVRSVRADLPRKNSCRRDPD